jgi:hypothetical protein
MRYGILSSLGWRRTDQLTEAVSRAPAGGKVNPFTSFQGIQRNSQFEP